MADMKTLTIGDKTYTVVDEEARKGLENKLDTTGDGSDVTATFTSTEERTNIGTGEKLSVLFGKITKWFADLKTVAFSGSYNDLIDKPTIPKEASLSGLGITATADELNYMSGVTSAVQDQIDSKAASDHTQSAASITNGMFAGQVVAHYQGQSYNAYCLRNSKLASTDTDPTVNGQICWTYS